ncbi:Uu.00g035690.m01.CDS01 [Anthostomella pinea]|uniref:Uu.00g035690.m01.CDS01 n=1 Tax=Anthostomella pinea TaxID=933095 RepID=A0AAI8YDE1_9PEZI|nr:Uu.00g035690.m01.CDS01 [Anthostomella pinea]
MAAETTAFDVVIVGGGTAGLVVASRLSEDPSLQVLVLEAGLDLPQMPEQLMQAVLTPAANTQLYKTPVDWDLRTIAQSSTLILDDEKANLGGRELSFPQGKMLGGSSGLNGLSFTASAKTVVDGWAELGNHGWEWPAFSQSLAKTYTVAMGPSLVTKPSNNQGPLQVAYADDCMGNWPKIWADTIESLGFPGAQDTLTGQAAGGLMVPDTVDPALGIRSYAANAYLNPEVRGRANLTLRTGVEVKKVLLKKPEGVEITDPTTGATTTVIAHREVIIAAGAFGSPKLLELCGIGDAGRLCVDHVVVDAPGVGVNLQNHPLITLSFEVASDSPPTKDAFVRAALRQDGEVLGGPMKEYMEHRTGPFASSGMTSAAQLPLPGLDTPEGRQELEGLFSTTGPSPSGVFALTHERFVRAILSSRSEASGYYTFGSAYAAFNPDGTSALPPMDASEDSYITVVLMLAHPLSRGSVHVVGAAAEQTLAIDLGYFSHPLDLEVMARHLQFIEQGLTVAEPLAKWLKPNGKRTVGAPEAGAFKDLEVAKK